MSTASHSSVKPLLLSVLALAVSAALLPAATLEKLTVDQMIIKSTAIVRGKVLNSYTNMSGPIIYTHYRVEVSETLKGQPRAIVDLGYPGGTINGKRQSFAGVPTFSPGDEYIFFLWGGKSGLTQVVGLSQGLFAIPRGDSADPVTTRVASHETILDPATGKPAAEQPVTMRVSELRARIHYIMRGASN